MVQTSVMAVEIKKMGRAKRYLESKKSTACANELNMGVKGEVVVRMPLCFPENKT